MLVYGKWLAARMAVIHLEIANFKNGEINLGFPR